jgi:hypothetical protein
VTIKYINAEIYENLHGLGNIETLILRDMYSLINGKGIHDIDNLINEMYRI